MASTVATISLGPWGGSGGNPWSFVATGGITGIIIKLDAGNDIIESIAFRDASDNTYGPFGGNGCDSYLTAISGTYGEVDGCTVITSLKFTTNVNTNGYGPIGRTIGVAFSIAIEDSVVVGFFGRSGGHLDALGIFVQSDGSVALGPWGGPDGTTGPFSFKVENWITEITVYSDERIIGIAVKDANGILYEKIANAEPYNQDTFKIAGPSEHVTSITGTYGDNDYPHCVVTSLSINTNVATYGPFGTEMGTYFSIPINGSVVVGFHGRSGDYIDAIGIFVKPDLAI